MRLTSQDTKARSSISGCHWLISMLRSLMPGAAGGVSRASSTTADGREEGAQAPVNGNQMLVPGCLLGAAGGTLDDIC